MSHSVFFSSAAPNLLMFLSNFKSSSSPFDLSNLQAFDFVVNLFVGNFLLCDVSTNVSSTAEAGGCCSSSSNPHWSNIPFLLLSFSS